MATKRVVCKECKKEQWITRDDVKAERLPVNIPFTSSFHYYYNCKHCKCKNGLWPEQVPER